MNPDARLAPEWWMNASKVSDSSAVVFRPGTPYRILSRLGGGSVGEVFLAAHAALGKEVAIKVLRSEYASSVVWLDRLRAEARLLARLKHPALVAVHDLGVT